MLLQIDKKQIDPDITVLEFTGKISLGRESQRIETLVEDLTKKGASRVVFDMSGVGYIDSAGVGMIALAAGRLREAGGSLAVVAPQGGRVQQLLTLTQMSAIMTVRDNLTDALTAV